MTQVSYNLKDSILVRLRRVIEILNGRLDFSTNFYSKIVDIADTGLADTEFTVTHNLGKIPIGYIWNTSLSGIVYDSNRATWTSTQMTLKCSVAHSTLKLVVF